MKKVESIFLYCALGLLGGACGPHSSSSLKEMINQDNAPDRLQFELNWESNLKALPTRGESRRAVWSGNWWPLTEGGTTETMKKYDAATGANAAAWEQTTVNDNGRVYWAGHCNGLASAGIREKRPRKAVVYKGVTFTREDIEALLVEKWQDSGEVPLVGLRCNESPRYDSKGRITNKECRDFNPGSFHIILGNMLGKQATAFVIDVEIDTEVWNYPVVWYRSEVTTISKDEAMKLTSQQGSYKFNPAAKKFRKVNTNVLIATGSTRIYDYILELDDKQTIIGGEWILSSKSNHPDFAWYMAEPMPANPNLDIKVIDEIAAASFN